MHKPLNPPSYWRRNWQVITGLVSAVILLGGGLYIQHRSDNPAMSDKPAASAPGSATYKGDITEVDLHGLYAGTIVVQPSGQRRSADVQTSGTEGGSLRVITTVRGNKLTVRQTGDCVTPGMAQACVAMFTLSVPRHARITGEAKGAAITFNQLQGEIDVHNAGALTANATSGRLRLETDSGPIVLNETASQEVEALTRNGALNLAFSTPPSKLQATTDKGDADVRLPSIGSYRVTADTPAGSKQVSVKQSDSSSRDISIRSNSGSVTVHN